MSEHKRSDKNKTAYPVFRGLESLGISESEIAADLAVPARMVRDWRAGREPIAGSRLAFLTRLLDRLVTQGATVAAYGDARNTSAVGRLTRARDGLDQQKAFNRALSTLQEREGARLFAAWERRKLGMTAKTGAARDDWAVAAG